MLARCVVASLASALAACTLTDTLTSEPLPAPIVAPAQISASGLRAYLDTMDGLASPDPARQAAVFKASACWKLCSPHRSE